MGRRYLKPHRFIHLQGPGIGLYVPASLVLLHVDDSRVHIEGERIPDQGLVANSPLHLDCLRGCSPHLATG